MEPVGELTAAEKAASRTWFVLVVGVSRDFSVRQRFCGVRCEL